MRRAQVDKGSQPVRNLMTFPGFETASGTTTVKTNSCAYGSLEAPGTTANVRTNLATDPAATSDLTSFAGKAGWRTTRWFGSGTPVGTHTFMTGQTDGPIPQLTTYLRKQWSSGITSPATNADTGFEFTAGMGTATNSQGLTISPSTTYTVSVYLRPSSDKLAAIEFWWHAADGTYITRSNPGYQTILANQWTRLSFTATSPANAATVGICADTDGGALWTAGETLDGTGLLIEAFPAVGPYFDGSVTAQQNLCFNPSFTTNVVGWGGIGASVVRVTNQGGDGAVAEVTQTVSGGGRQGGIFLFGANQPAGNYSVSFDLKGTDASFTDARVLFYDPVAVANRVNVTTPLIKDGNYNRYSFNVVATGVFDRIYIEVLGSSIPLGTKTWMDRILIEAGNTPSTIYYEDYGDFTYAWAGTANASVSYQKAPNLAGWVGATQAITYQSVTSPMQGAKCGAVITKGANGDGIFHNDIAVTGNTAYTLSAWIRLTAALPNFTFQLRWKDSGQTILRDDNANVVASLVVGSWVRVSATFTSHASATLLQPIIRVLAAHTPTLYYLDGACVNEGLDNVYFDGATPAAGDFTYAWIGTVNGSSSTQTAPAVSGMTGNYSSRVAYQSADWSASGSKSLCVLGFRPSVDSFSQFNNPAVFGSTPLANRTFTFMAKLKTLESFPVGADGRAWSFNITYNRSGGGTGLINCKPSTTGAQVHMIQQTVTFPSDATTVAFMRFYNGTPNNVPVYWDNAMIVEGDYQGDFINPTQSVLAKWDGTANASTSVGYPPQLLDIAGKPLGDYTAAGDYVYANEFDPVNGVSLYTVFQTLSIMTANVATIAIYGENALADVIPNSMMTLRQNASSGSTTRNDIANRRTGGGGALVPNGTISTHVAAWGVTNTNLVFLQSDNSALAVDSALPAVKHERFRIVADSAYHKHVRTLIFPGYHSTATRQAMSRYLGNKYGANVA